MNGISTCAAPFEVVGPCASTEGEEMHWVWTFQWLDLVIFLRIDSIAQLVTFIKKPSLFFPFQDMTKKRQGRDWSGHVDTGIECHALFFCWEVDEEAELKEKEMPKGKDSKDPQKEKEKQKESFRWVCHRFVVTSLLWLGGSVKQCHGHMAYRDLCHSLSSQTNMICQVKVLPVLIALQQKAHKLQSILFKSLLQRSELCNIPFMSSSSRSSRFWETEWWGERSPSSKSPGLSPGDFQRVRVFMAANSNHVQKSSEIKMRDKKKRSPLQLPEECVFKIFWNLLKSFKL